MITVRLAQGVTSHFPMRALEWIMLWPAFFMGVVLLLQTDMFALSPSFTQLGRWAGESLWAVVVLSVCMIRLFALFINGTFDAFKFSPHLRMFASVVALFFWAQFCLGFLIAAIYWGGAWSAVPAYSGLAVCELLNIYRAGNDVGRTTKR